MPPVKVLLFKNERGECPILNWLNIQSIKVEAKAKRRIEMLAQQGHQLRRPYADYLRDGIYELRWRSQSVNYRVLYFFYGGSAVVISHGLTKEGVVPIGEVDLAVRCKKLFESSPHQYSAVL